jgi:hypothetical protein
MKSGNFLYHTSSRASGLPRGGADRTPTRGKSPVTKQDANPRNPDSRRGAVIGLIVILLLVLGGLLLVHVLQHMSQIQDCAMSGRTNCASIDSPASGN